jgi:hypothetical protein
VVGVAAADILIRLAPRVRRLTDFVLPDNDGVWLLEQVNKSPRPIPVIAIKRLRRKPAATPGGAAAPFAGKLLKPLDFDQVCAEIAVVLGSGQ